MVKKPKKLPNIDSWLKIKMRRISIYWPGRTEALKRARVSPGKYQCDGCEHIFGMIKIEGKDKKGNKKTRYKNPLEMDHIESVIPVDGDIYRKDKPDRIDWNKYFDRLLVPPEGFSAKCHHCHSIKTELENSLRPFYKKEKKTKLGQQLIKSLDEVLESKTKKKKD